MIPAVSIRSVTDVIGVGIMKRLTLIEHAKGKSKGKTIATSMLDRRPEFRAQILA